MTCPTLVGLFQGSFIFADSHKFVSTRKAFVFYSANLLMNNYDLSPLLFTLMSS